MSENDNGAARGIDPSFWRGATQPRWTRRQVLGAVGGGLALSLMGGDPADAVIRRHIGAMIETPRYPPFLTATELLASNDDAGSKVSMLCTGRQRMRL